MQTELSIHAHKSSI